MKEKDFIEIVNHAIDGGLTEVDIADATGCTDVERCRRWLCGQDLPRPEIRNAVATLIREAAQANACQPDL